MQRDLVIVIEHLVANGLDYNALKIVYTIFRHPRTELELEFHHVLQMGNQEVDRVDVAKYLGCHIDETLSFNKHIDMIVSKLRSNVLALRRSRHHLTQEAAWNIYMQSQKNTPSCGFL